MRPARRLLDGSLGQVGDAGRAALDEVADACAEAIGSGGVKPSRLDRAATQVDWLERLCRAHSVLRRDDSALVHNADRLAELAQHM